MTPGANVHSSAGGIEYWPTEASIIQVDINPDRIGLTKPVTVGIAGDAKKVAAAILGQLSASAGEAARQSRRAMIESAKALVAMGVEPPWSTQPPLLMPGLRLSMNRMMS